MSNVQVIIVGQGFAGTALAWSLANRGLKFIVVDDAALHTSSRIAAGLVTPVTGQRSVKTWKWEEAWECAKRFYPEVETRTNTSFWNVCPALRLHDSHEERLGLEARLSSYPELFAPYQSNFSDECCFDSSNGGFVIKVAARLDGTSYLNASRLAFQQMDAYRTCSLDLNKDIEVNNDSIQIRSSDIRAECIVFCQGYSPEINPWFSNLPMAPAQGDILTVDIPDFHDGRTIHRKVWMTPACNHPTNTVLTHYLVGSTYRWQTLDGIPSREARQAILSKLTRWLKLPFDVIDQRSAVRPASFDQKPLLGPSSLDPRIWVFNGLGSKGSLMAPWCAQKIVDCLMDGANIPPALLWNRRRP